MCTAEAAATGIQGLSNAYAQYEQGQVNEASLNYQANIAEDNATNAEYAAKDARSRGQRELAKQRQRVKQLLGQQRVAYGASGVDVTAGVPVDVLTETIRHGEDDAVTIRFNSEQEVISINQQAAGFRRGATGLRDQAGVAVTVANLAAGTTLLTSSVNAGLSGFKSIQANKQPLKKVSIPTRAETWIGPPIRVRGV